MILKEQKSTLDIAKIRNDFPTLAEQVHGKPLVYLDNAATTQKPQSVIGAMNKYYRDSNANVHRALHVLAERATSGYEAAREEVRSFINAGSIREIVYTRGTTEGINLIARSLGDTLFEEGDEIILSEMEHHSNIVPWQLLAERKKITLKYIPVLENGELDMAAYASLLGPRTRLVSIMHMSNVLGTVNPVKEITHLAHKQGALVLIDGAQAVPSLPLDVQEIDCDFYAFSSHKMVGPTGIGVLYAREEWLNRMPPFLGGGEMISEVSLEKSTWADLPHKFEAGTPNIAGAFGLRAAVQYLKNTGMENIQSYEEELTAYAMEKMRSVEGLKILGTAANRGPALSFVLDKVHPFDLSQFLDQTGIAIRAGHHCAQPLMKRFGINATARASLYFYNTRDEVDYFVENLNKAVHFFA